MAQLWAMTPEELRRLQRESASARGALAAAANAPRPRMGAGMGALTTAREYLNTVGAHLPDHVIAATEGALGRESYGDHLSRLRGESAQLEREHPVAAAGARAAGVATGMVPLSAFWNSARTTGETVGALGGIGALYGGVDHLAAGGAPQDVHGPMAFGGGVGALAGAAGRAATHIPVDMYDAGRATYDVGRRTGLIEEPKPQAPREWSFDELGFPVQSIAPREQLPVTPANEQGFYSASLWKVEQNPQARQSAENWDRWLKNQGNVSKEELEAIGWDRFVAENRGENLTRDEVAAFIRSNQPVVEERVLGGVSDVQVSVSREPDADGVHVATDQNGNQVAIVRRAADGGYVIKSETLITVDGAAPRSLNEAEHIIQGDASKFRNEATTRFSNVVIPGGEPGSYREILVRDPSLEAEKLAPADEAKRAALQAEYDTIEHRARANRQISSADSARQVRLSEELKPYRRDPKYRSHNFQDQELLHLRVDDRTGPNGERILFINELQSDLHQAGRRGGYRSPDRARKMEAAKSEIDPAFERMLNNEITSGEFDAIRAEVLRRHGYENFDEFSDARNAPPNAPFKGDHWIHLGLKTALRRAVVEGYDAIAWARSDQIAEAVGESQGKLATLYDQKIPSFLKKYTKPWGGRVEAVALIRDQQQLTDSPSFQRAYEQELDRLGIDNRDLSAAGQARQNEVFMRLVSDPPKNSLLRITSEMREAIKETGQPLFGNPAVARVGRAADPRAIRLRDDGFSGDALATINDENLGLGRRAAAVKDYYRRNLSPFVVDTPMGEVAFRRDGLQELGNPVFTPHRWHLVPELRRIISEARPEDITVAPNEKRNRKPLHSRYFYIHRPVIYQGEPKVAVISIAEDVRPEKGLEFYHVSMTRPGAKPRGEPFREFDAKPPEQRVEPRFTDEEHIVNAPQFGIRRDE